MKCIEIRDFLLANSQTEEFNIKQIENLLRTIYKRLNLAELINSILDDESTLQELASKSYSHSLGFDKIIISPYNKSNFQLRFNIWWGDEGTQNNYEDIHNHRWDFSTAVLFGSYDYENYEFHKKGEKMRHYHYYPDKNGKHVLEFKGYKNMQVASSGSLKQGDFMSFRSNFYHKVMPVTYPTLTLFMTGKPKITKVSVFRKEEPNNKEEGHASSMPVSELKEKLHKILVLSNA